jgi:hypothetical protein
MRIGAVEMLGCDAIVCNVSIVNVFVCFNHTVYSSNLFCHSAYLSRRMSLLRRSIFLSSQVILCAP